MKILRNRLRLCLLATLLLGLPAVVQAQFTFTTNGDNTITITGYTGSNSVVVIPDMTNGYPVTSINDGAFSFCTGLTGITIPNNITNIGEQAFYGCATLTNVMIPSRVISVGSLAFGNCFGLTSVTIPNSVTSIGDGAFASCSSLKNIIIPNSITNIGTVVFEASGFTNVTIPDSVIDIGDSAFCGCTNLVSITIPSSVISIEPFAFESCVNLKNVFFKGNAPTISLVVFPGDAAATAYYLPGATGWGINYSGISAVLWNPQAQTDNLRTGGQTNQFGFSITGTTNIPVVVEASTNLGSNWTILQSISLTNGFFHFSDPQWTNCPGRFYRIRSP